MNSIKNGTVFHLPDELKGMNMQRAFSLWREECQLNYEQTRTFEQYMQDVHGCPCVTLIDQVEYLK